MVLVSESSLKGLCLDVGLCGESGGATFNMTVPAETTTVSLMTVWGSEPLERGQLAWSVRSPSNVENQTLILLLV